MIQDAPTAQLQPSRIRSITIFAVLVTASISGAVAAQFNESNMPVSIGQPDSTTVPDSTPDPLAFTE